MRILIQRVRRASVSIGGTLKSAIGPGLLVFVGIEAEDGEEDIERTFYSGTARTLFYDAYSVSSITLGIRYRFNATNSKYNGTGAGQSQKRRM